MDSNSAKAEEKGAEDQVSEDENTCTKGIRICTQIYTDTHANKYVNATETYACMKMTKRIYFLKIIIA